MRRFLLAVLLAAVSVPHAQAQNTPDGEPPPPWELGRRAEGEPAWAPLLRLRSAEADYEGTRWWDAHLQYRAFMEANLGQHAEALRLWDTRGGAPDSIGVLPPGTHAAPAVDYLAAVADTAQVVMINERHHADADRLLTLRLLPLLYEQGYRYLAAEALVHADSTLNERTYPIEGVTGVYTDAPAFAAVVREALRLGYTLVPYEITADQRAAESDLSPMRQRDRAQAQNLYDQTLGRDPDARVLVHAGYDHILEAERGPRYPMALYFSDLSGVNPVTVDQTRLSERSTPAYEHPAYRTAVAAELLTDAPVVLLDADGEPLSPARYPVDLQVLTPRTTYDAGRPAWMTLGGARTAVDVPVPDCQTQTCFVEARLAGEPAEAVPLDRAEVTEASTVRLYLPPGQTVEVTAYTAVGRRVHTATYGDE